MPARTAASLMALGLLFGAAQAQEGTRALSPPVPYPAVNPDPPKSYYYQKPAGMTGPASDPRSPLNDKPGSLGKPVPTDATLTPDRALPPIEQPGFHFQSTAFQSPVPQKGSVSPAPLGASPAVSGRPGEEVQEYYIELNPPGPQELFRLDSELAMQERIRQKARERTPVERVEFPTEPVVGTGPFVQRTFAASNMAVEPHYVCYGRLYFEELNSERYGWDLGPIQPFVSAGVFFKDVVFLPYHAFSDPFRYHDCSSGYCLPGDPVPYMIYPPGLSVTGALAEAGVVTAMFAIFPGP
jgi:hypothetical protein